MRNENVETVQAGDRYDFTGTLIVVPDVSVMSTPSARAESASGQKRGDANNEGVRGLKCLGIRDLNYKLAFLACSLSTTDSRVKIIYLKIINELKAKQNVLCFYSLVEVEKCTMMN